MAENVDKQHKLEGQKFMNTQLWKQLLAKSFSFLIYMYKLLNAD